MRSLIAATRSAGVAPNTGARSVTIGAIGDDEIRGCGPLAAAGASAGASAGCADAGAPASTQTQVATAPAVHTRSSPPG